MRIRALRPIIVVAAMTTLLIASPAGGAGQSAPAPKSKPAATPVPVPPRELTAHLIGHAHIDLSWLWRWEETVADIARYTFQGTLAQMDKMPGPDLRPEPGGDLRRHREGPARALRRDRPQDQGRDLGPGRRDVGRARRQHARRRSPRPPAPLRQALLPRQVRRRRQGRLEPRHFRAQLADAPDPAPGRDRLLRLRPLRARAGPDAFLLVGGDGRLARPRLRAGRLVQRQPPGRDAQDPRGRAQEHGHQGLPDPLRRRGPRRRAARRGPRRHQEIPRGPERAAARLRPPGAVSQGDRGRERPVPPGRQARAQLHLPGLLHDPGGDQEEQPPAREPARHGREVLRDRRGLGVPGLLPRARHRRGLEDRPPQPVPRHPRRLEHRPRL